MGLGTESAMLSQLKKGQGETNERLDAILAELRMLRAAVQQQTSGQQSVLRGPHPVPSAPPGHIVDR
jgi:hypothetical protein